MTLKNNPISFLFFLILLCSTNKTFGQRAAQNTITYKSPSSNFIDITIQTHKGLPRFGEPYYRRGITPPTNKNAYIELLKMKFLAKAYADMDKTKLMDPNHTFQDQKKKKFQIYPGTFNRIGKPSLF